MNDDCRKEFERQFGDVKPRKKYNNDGILIYSDPYLEKMFQAFKDKHDSARTPPAFEGGLMEDVYFIFFLFFAVVIICVLGWFFEGKN